MSRNLNILSLLDNDDKPKLTLYLSQFQTLVFPGDEPAKPTPSPPAAKQTTPATALPVLVPAPNKGFINEHMKKFQTQLTFGDTSAANSALSSPTNNGTSSTTNTTKTGSPSKASITSLMNADEPNPSASGTVLGSTPATKRKRPAKKKPAAGSPDAGKAPEKVLKKLKTAKKTPEPAAAMPVTDPKTITAGSTTNKLTAALAKTPAPSIMNLLNEETPEPAAEKPSTPAPPTPAPDLATDLQNKEGRDKPKELPIIALNIPLVNPSNPEPGQAEVVVNVLKMLEDKYGWGAIHPNAKLAIDIMDDMLDDDDDMEGSDLEDAPKKTAPPPQNEELTEEQLVHQHEVRMNRKVGKYDYEDPFIDDVELQMEEEIFSTKEGFFVYWGPLVEEKATVSKKKKK